VLCSTNAIESLNARYRRTVTVRATSRSQAVSKCLYLVTKSLDPKGACQTRWTIRRSQHSTRSPSPSGDRMPKAENL
jgi:putative transposase